MKSKPEIVIVSKEIWRQLVVDTLFNTLSLATSSRVLLKENMKENKDVKFEDPHVAASLYLFAIEEFGKVFDIDEFASLENRMSIIYSDLNGENVNVLPQVDAEKLQICLEKFIEIVEDKLALFNTQNPP